MNYIQAIDIAKEKMNYGNRNIYYRLGIYEVNTDIYSSIPQYEYKLVWYIQGGNKHLELYHIVIIDANNGEVYPYNDGIIIY